jgi:hypothetical protein
MNCCSVFVISLSSPLESHHSHSSWTVSCFSATISLDQSRYSHKYPCCCWIYLENIVHNFIPNHLFSRQQMIHILVYWTIFWSRIISLYVLFSSIDLFYIDLSMIKEQYFSIYLNDFSFISELSWCRVSTNCLIKHKQAIVPPQKIIENN